MELNKKTRLFLLLFLSSWEIFCPSDAHAQKATDTSTPTFNEIRLRAQSGDPDAECRLGLAYYYGDKRVGRDTKKALYWLEKGSAAGNSDCSNNLGRIYEMKIRAGVPDATQVRPDVQKAARYYLDAFQQGNNWVTWDLCRLYEQGVTVTGDYAGLAQRLEKCPSTFSAAKILLAELYWKGQGVSQDATKARELLRAVPDDGNADPSKILEEMEGFRVLNAGKGVVEYDSPAVQPFYIWRRVYQKRGQSQFGPYRIASDESVRKLDDFGSTYKEWKSRRGLAGAKPQKNWTSSDGKWRVEQVPDQNSATKNKPNATPEERMIRFVNVSIGNFSDVDIPSYDEGDSSAMWIGWNPHADLFYFSLTGGADTGRHLDIYQLNPEKKTIVFMGSGSALWGYSNDGRWVIWGDGNWMDYEDRQIVAFDTTNNKNYTLTAGHSDNIFIDWTNHWDSIWNHVKTAKALYRHKDYAGAISEYRKVLRQDPNNCTAYGLMGYSLLRAGRVDEAVSCLGKSVQLDPQYTMGYYNLALAYWAQGKQNQAVEQVRLAIDYDPGCATKIKKDPQFQPFRSLAAFRALVH
ncbi:MAG: tetratricopeptide repeat protein [bacterium]